MKRAGLDASWCPIARSLGPLGDPWTLLILRDAFYGLTRFDEFEQSLGAAPNVLSARLKKLVEDGLMERRRYSERPPRDEYRLTQAGLDTKPITIALLQWGNRYRAVGHDVVLVDTETGQEVTPIMMDPVSLRPLSDPVFKLAARRDAPAAVHQHLAAKTRREQAAAATKADAVPRS